MNEAERTTPDVFSAELHFALLTEGLRGPTMRRLMRLARRDSELGQIFETKVAEFRRFLRSDRKPSLANLPLRIWERLFDDARFTPPKEVLVTLFYVGLVMAGIELFKRSLHSNAWPEGVALSQAASFDSARIALTSESAWTNAEVGRVEKWMIDELQRASRSPAWREMFAKQLAETIEAINLEPVLTEKVEAVIQSPAFSERVLRLLESRLSSFREEPAVNESAEPNGKAVETAAVAAESSQPEGKPSASAGNAVDRKADVTNTELAKAGVAPGAIQ